MDEDRVRELIRFRLTTLEHVAQAHATIETLHQALARLVARLYPELLEALA